MCPTLQSASRPRRLASKREGLPIGIHKKSPLTKVSGDFYIYKVSVLGYVYHIITKLGRCGVMGNDDQRAMVGILSKSHKQ